MEYLTNVLFTLNRTTYSSKSLLCVVRINVNKTLIYVSTPTAVYQHENTSIHCTVLMEKYYDQCSIGTKKNLPLEGVPRFR